MIPIKTQSEIDQMRKLGAILGNIFERLKESLEPGIKTIELDKLSASLMRDAGVKSAFLGYRGYPANICVSVNEEVVHGIPGNRILKNSDIVSLDMGIKSDGLFVDMAKTYYIGNIDPKEKELVEVSEGSLQAAIKLMKPGNRLSDLSHAVQEFAESRNFSVVRDFVGHGIGHQLHEEPQIPNFGAPGKGPLLKDGMVLAIEPMINLGSWEVVVADDGWTAITKDLMPSAHFEHTVAIWNGGPKILTLAE